MTESALRFPASESRSPDFNISLNRIASVLREGSCFLLMTHRDPDPDGIGSMLALGKALLNAKKDVVLLTEKPVSGPENVLKGADKIVQHLDFEKHLDGVVVLDCGETERVGGPPGCLEGRKPLINIDHHETNTFFGDLNLVDANTSSAGELVFRVIEQARLPMDSEVAENIFVAIQADTGSFMYQNTTAESLKTAARMVDYGARPWEISRKMMGEYGVSRLKLLEMALSNIEFHHRGEVGMISLSLEMFERAQAYRADSEKFIDYPRFMSGVELAVLIRQTGENDYEFSLRSNDRVNVARLASLFGGGGHARAAGFKCHGSMGDLKKDFLKEAARFLDVAGRG